MAKHTPGPWVIHPDSPFEIVMNDGDVYPLIATVAADNAFNEDQAIADARLITAAPKLLVALKHTLGLLKVFTRETDAVAKAAWDQAEAAIAEAEG